MICIWPEGHLYSKMFYSGVTLRKYKIQTGADNLTVLTDGKPTLVKDGSEMFVHGMSIPNLMDELQKWLDVDSENMEKRRRK